MANATCLITCSVRFRMRKQNAKGSALPTHVFSADKRGIDGTAYKVPRDENSAQNSSLVPFFQKPPSYFLTVDKREWDISFCQAFSLTTAGLSGKLFTKSLCAVCITIIEKHHQYRPVTAIIFQVHHIARGIGPIEWDTRGVRGARSMGWHEWEALVRV